MRPIEFNDRLLQQNAELAQFAADAAKETRELHDAVEAINNHQRHPRVGLEDGVQVITILFKLLPIFNESLKNDFKSRQWIDV